MECNGEDGNFYVLSKHNLEQSGKRMDLESAWYYHFESLRSECHLFHTLPSNNKTRLLYWLECVMVNAWNVLFMVVAVPGVPIVSNGNVFSGLVISILLLIILVQQSIIIRHINLHNCSNCAIIRTVVWHQYATNPKQAHIHTKNLSTVCLLLNVLI